VTLADHLLTPARILTAPLRLSSAIAEEALDAAQQGRQAIESATERAALTVLDAVVVRLLDDDVIDRLLARAEAAGVAQRVVDRILTDGVLEQVADRILSGPELERMLAAAFESALPEELIAQLLASEAVWVLVDEVARSPSVTDAIAHQGTGFLEQVAARTRDRSRDADSALQRLADKIGRRRRAGAPLPDPSALPRPPQGAGEGPA
jgi:hypothetical protein